MPMHPSLQPHSMTATVQIAQVRTTAPPVISYVQNTTASLGLPPLLPDTNNACLACTGPHIMARVEVPHAAQSPHTAPASE